MYSQVCVCVCKWVYKLCSQRGEIPRLGPHATSVEHTVTVVSALWSTVLWAVVGTPSARHHPNPLLLLLGEDLHILFSCSCRAISI